MPRYELKQSEDLTRCAQELRWCEMRFAYRRISVEGRRNKKLGITQRPATLRHWVATFFEIASVAVRQLLLRYVRQSKLERLLCRSVPRDILTEFRLVRWCSQKTARATVGQWVGVAATTVTAEKMNVRRSANSNTRITVINHCHRGKNERQADPDNLSQLLSLVPLSPRKK